MKRMTTTRLSYAIRQVITASAACSLLSLALPVQAESSTACFTASSVSDAGQRALLALPATQNLCIRAVHEGRAAVLLPDARQAIDDVALAPAMSGHRWGFLDNHGQLVIKPVFEQVGDYHYGLAAAKQQGKWGYIDTTGNWAIPPTFDKAGSFTLAELAVVTTAGKAEIINRKGQTVGKPLDELVDDVSLSDGNPARLALSYKTVLLSPDDHRHVASDKMEVVQPFGQSDMFIARDVDKGFGIADQNLAWRLTPQFSAITLSDRNEMLAMAKSQDGIQLIRADGTLVEQIYPSVKALNGQFWLAKTADKNSLLDNSGSEVAPLSEAAVAGLTVQGDFLLDNSGKESLTVYIPGKKQPQSLPKDSVPFDQPTGGFLLTTKGDQHKVNAIITPGGNVLGGYQPASWLAQVNNAEVINGRLWLHDDQGQLINILDNSGKLLLSNKNASLLNDYRIQPLASQQQDNSAPLALVRPDPDQVKPGAGFIRADGSVQLENKWQDIQPADSSEAAQGGNAQQFIVKTIQGTGVIDAQGKILIPLTEDNIAPFVHGYAFDYLDGKLTVIDANGKHYALPDVFTMQSLGNGWFRFRETAKEGALWGIYDVINQKVIAPPSYLAVGTYANGLANVQLPNSLWGIINADGKPLVEAKYANVRRINNALWQLGMPVASADQPASSAASEIIANDGKVRIELTPDLNVNQFNDGRILATSGEGQSWLLNVQGDIELHEQQTKISAVGDWVKLSRQPQIGYLNAQGNWQIAPQVLPGTAFVNGRALRIQPQGTELIDDKGVRVAAMPDGNWLLPANSDMSVSYDAQDGNPTTRYVDNSGKLAITLPGVGSRMLAGQAVMALANGNKTWIDAQGHPTPEVNYRDLGLVVGGLAFARIGQEYGYIDAKGSFVIPPVYNAVSAFDSGVAIVSTTQMSMMLDSSGKPLARVGRECGIQVLYGSGNIRQWPQTMPVKCTAQP
jgi:hypothetical protein